MINIEKDPKRPYTEDEFAGVDKNALEIEATRGNERGLEFLAKKHSQYIERFLHPEEGFKEKFPEENFSEEKGKTFKVESGIKAIVATNMIFEGGKLNDEKKGKLSDEVQEKMSDVDEKAAGKYLKVIVPSIEGQWDNAVSNVEASADEEKTV